MTSIVTLMTSEQARALTDQIKAGVEATWELVKQAYTERAWTALGYESWDDYCTSEFGATRLRLPREERAEVVSSLRESGLSLRAIAAATGLSRGTVGNQVSNFGHLPPVPNGTPATHATIAHGAGFVAPGEQIPCDTETLIDSDSDIDIDSGEELGGQGYECDPCVSPDEPPPPDEPEPVAPQPQPKPITGLDGKTYNHTPITPKKLRKTRRPITTSFASTVYALTKNVNTIENLSKDDRFYKNLDQIAYQLSDLNRANDVLQHVIKMIRERNQS